MIHNLYIISEGGIAIYSQNIARLTMDEQLISGFLLAVGSFTMETVGSGLKKIEMQTGEQIFVYYDSLLKLTAAAITGAQDHPKKVSKILKTVLDKFDARFDRNLIQTGNIGNTSEFNSELNQLMKANSTKRDKKKFILGLALGSLLLVGLYILMWGSFLNLIVKYFLDMRDLPWAGPPNSQVFLSMIYIFGDLALGLEINLIVCFIPSAFLGGYVAGSRNKGKLLGIIFFFFTILLSLLMFIFFIKNDDIKTASFLFLWMMIIFVPLVLVTSITLSYLGGYFRDRRKLYPIPEELVETSKKLEKKEAILS